MRSLMRELRRQHGADFHLKGRDTLAYSFEEDSTSDDALRTALAKLKAHQPGCVALLRQGVAWTALP